MLKEQSSLPHYQIASSIFLFFTTYHEEQKKTVSDDKILIAIQSF